MTEKKVTVRIAMEGGKVVEAELLGIGKKGSDALGQVANANDRVSKTSGAMRANVQNAAFQFQDFFVQVSSGTSATRALGQQLPQLLGSFGLFGVLAGTAAAALVPMIGLLYDSADPVKELTQDLDALAAATAHLKQMNEVYSTKGIESLIEKYGELDVKVLAMIEHQRQFAEIEAFDAAKKAVGDLKSGFSELNGLVKEYDNFTRAGVDDPQWLINAQSALDQIDEQFGLTIDQARQLQFVLGDAQGATGIGDMADAVARLTELIQGSTLEGTDFAKALLEAEDNLRQLNAQGVGIGGWLGAAISGASDLAANLWDAVSANTALARKEAGPGMDTGSADWAKNSLGFTKPGAELIYTAPKTRQGGGGISDAPKTRQGGGGISDAQKAQKEQMREAQQLYEQTRTEAEKYAEEQAKIDDLMQAGAISADTYQRAIEMIGKKYSEAGKFFEQIDGDIKDAFIDLALTGENAFGRIADAIKRAALEALLFGEGPLSGIFGGAASGGLLGGLFGGATSGSGGTVGSLFSFEGGGYTGSGSRSGGIDGRGGMLSILHPQEVVTDLTKGSGGAANITFAPTIDARGADAGAVARLESALARVQAEFESRVIQTVNSATKRRQLV